MSRSANWVFTINNYTSETIELLESIPVEKAFVIFGEETAPSTGTKHLQGFIALADRSKRRTVERLIGGKAWLEVTHSPQSAIGYSVKDEAIHTNEGSMTDLRLAGLVREAKEFGSEVFWLGSVILNGLDSDTYKPCRVYHEMSVWNWCSSGTSVEDE